MPSKAATRESIRRMARVGRCWSPTFSPAGDQLAFVSDLNGSPQVWSIPLEGGFPRAISAFEEQVNAVVWSPAGDWLAVESALGGGMNAQIDILRPDGGERRRLTAAGTTNNWLGGWTKDGRHLLFSSNMDRPDSIDCFRFSIAADEVGKVTHGSGTCVIEDVSADGSLILVKRVAYRGDSNVYLVNSDSEAEDLLTEHLPPAHFDNARFSHDGRAVYVISNRTSDLACLCRLDLDDVGEWGVVRARADAELDEFALRKDGESAALVWNIAGRHELELINLDNAQSRRSVNLPGEIVHSLRFSPDGTTLAMCISGALLPEDIWLLDTGSLNLRQLTHSPHVGVDLGNLSDAELRTYSAHDGLSLSGWYYAPLAGTPPYPTVLSFHGGPEGQEQPVFRYDYQALLAEGIAVFAPNVRGSSGFGKRFVNLDNGALRVDAVQDIESTAKYVVKSGIAQAGRLGIMGGSYGGYMTMAGLTEFPQRYAAGVNLYGVVNFKTFFELTEPWMASISKVEYGDPETEGDMLDALSPINKLERVTAPTLVLHGANDTNVPVYEAEQVVTTLRERGIAVEYILFPDEGHGFRIEANRITAADAIVNWFTTHLLD